MSSRVFQSVIVQMKEATDRCIGVVDEQGFVIACSELSMIGSHLDDLQAALADNPEQIFTSAVRTYKLLGVTGSRFDYAVFVAGHDAVARSVCILASVAMNEARSADASEARGVGAYLSPEYASATSLSASR